MKLVVGPVAPPAGVLPIGPNVPDRELEKDKELPSLSPIGGYPTTVTPIETGKPVVFKDQNQK